MKLGASSSYNTTKEFIISLYPCFERYFEEVERKIQEDPLASSEEIIIYEGKPRHVRKRYVKTTFFSGLLPDTYKYLTITYAITKDDWIIFLYANLHDYID
jgi:hypothetical protein